MKLVIALLPFFIDGLLAANLYGKEQQAEVCYPPCGCFTNDPPHNGRPLPESPEQQALSWRLYTRQNPNVGTDIDLYNTQVPPDFVATKKTKFLIHGWQSSPGLYASMLSIKDAFLQKFDYNVVVVDWSTGANQPLYIDAMVNTRVVGACSGQLGRQMGVSSSRLHCVGHSLGGHTCGYMGEYLSGDMGRATGLDPAGPGFGYDNDTRLRLDATDAVFVDIIHTNIDAVFELGLGVNTGHVDFYPNKGGKQPGCSTSACSHGACTDFFIASIAESSCQFTAYPCASNADADAGRCSSCNPSTTCQRQGYYADTQPGRGTFFLETNANYPYCQT